MNKKITLLSRNIIDKLIFLEKNTSLEFEGISLHPSEIHIILYINRNEGVAKNATRIAEQIGVTKGAISQTLSRLERKEILYKIKDPYNKNELIISFSKKGERALEQILAMHDKLLEEHKKILDDFPEKAKKIILQYLSAIEQTISKIHIEKYTSA